MEAASYITTVSGMIDGIRMGGETSHKGLDTRNSGEVIELKEFFGRNLLSKTGMQEYIINTCDTRVQNSLKDSSNLSDVAF